MAGRRGHGRTRPYHRRGEVSTKKPASAPRQKDPEKTMTFFEWLASVCAELGWGVLRAHDLLDDTWWSDRFERGLTPQQAAAEARRDGLA